MIGMFAVGVQWFCGYGRPRSGQHVDLRERTGLGTRCEAYQKCRKFRIVGVKRMKSKYLRISR